MLTRSTPIPRCSHVADLGPDQPGQLVGHRADRAPSAPSIITRASGSVPGVPEQHAPTAAQLPLEFADTLADSSDRFDRRLWIAPAR